MPAPRRSFSTFQSSPISAASASEFCASGVRRARTLPIRAEASAPDSILLLLLLLLLLLSIKFSFMSRSARSSNSQYAYCTVASQICASVSRISSIAIRDQQHAHLVGRVGGCLKGCSRFLPTVGTKTTEQSTANRVSAHVHRWSHITAEIVSAEHTGMNEEPSQLH